jgi:hypothetical protein
MASGPRSENSNGGSHSSPPSAQSLTESASTTSFEMEHRCRLLSLRSRGLWDFALMTFLIRTFAHLCAGYPFEIIRRQGLA